jgi:hypothetical protein
MVDGKYIGPVSGGGKIGPASYGRRNDNKPGSSEKLAGYFILELPPTTAACAS